MQSVPPPQNIESCTYWITCCLIESPSSLMGQFHRKNASRVPKLPGLSLGTREWSCPGMVNETSLFDKIHVQSYLIQRGKSSHKETRLKASRVQIELRNIK